MANPFLQGWYGAQQAADARFGNQISAMGGLLGLQKQAQEINDSNSLRNAVVMSPDGTLDANRTLAEIYRVNPVLGLKLQSQLRKESPFGKVDPKDFTPESIAKFSVTNNHSDLVPLRKLEFLDTGTHRQPVDPYSGRPVGDPFAINVSPNTTATLNQGATQFNQMFPIHATNAGVNSTRLFYDTGMAPAPVGGFSPAQIQAAGPAPAIPAGVPRVSPNVAPSSPSAAPTPTNFVPMGTPATDRPVDAAPEHIWPAAAPRPQVPQVFVPQGTQLGQSPAPQQGAPLPLSPRAQAEAAAKAPERIASLRKEFSDVPEVKRYRNVLPIIDSARKAPDTPAGDIDIIYAVGKVLDPESVVREGELNLVIKSGSPAQRVAGFFNYVKGGGRLTQGQRAELMTMLDGRAGELKNGYDAARETYGRVATAQNLPHDQIFMDTNYGRRGSDRGATPPVGAVQDGWRFKGGDPSKRENWERT